MHIDLPRLRALPDYAPFDPITCLCTACMPARCCHCALRHLVCIMRTHVSMVARTRAFVLSIYRSATRTIGNVPEGWRAPTSRRSKSCSSNNRRSNGSSSRSRQANGTAARLANRRSHPTPLVPVLPTIPRRVLLPFAHIPFSDTSTRVSQPFSGPSLLCSRAGSFELVGRTAVAERDGGEACGERGQVQT